MQKDKVETLLGFMVKAGNIVYGKDAVEMYRKKIHLIVACSTASQNTLKDIQSIAANKKINLILTTKPLEQIIHKTNCKVIAVTDFQASRAIEANINENYKLFNLAEVKN